MNQSLNLALHSHPSIKRWIFKLIAFGISIYLIFGTIIWTILINQTARLAIWSGEKMTGQEVANFKEGVHVFPAARVICDIGNWVNQYTHPLISDDIMIAHWKKYHKTWEAAIARADERPNGRDWVEEFANLEKRKTGEDINYAKFDKYLEAINLDRVYYDSILSDVDRFANMIPPQSLGKNYTAYRACSRMTSKTYTYYPRIPPVILNGKLVRQTTIEFTQKHRPAGEEPLNIGTVVESTDKSYYTATGRRLTEKWYISRFE